MSLLARELTAVAVAPRARRASGNRASKFRRASTAAVTSTSTTSSTSEKDFPSFFLRKIKKCTNFRLGLVEVLEYLFSKI